MPQIISLLTFTLVRTWYEESTPTMRIFKQIFWTIAIASCLKHDEAQVRLLHCVWMELQFQS